MVMGLLEGVKVLDFTAAFVGPFCSRIMADMGAEVIKVERPVRDDPGRFNPDTMNTRNGASFLHLNGGKKSLCVDLKTDRGLEIVHSLVKQVDVFVENFTPHVVRSYGLDYPNLRALNPGIIMCSMTGYGQEGLAGNPEHVCTDPIAQAMAGLNWITGERGGDPYTIGGGIGDTITGMTGALAIGYALFHRQRTGLGQFIDLSMIESVLFLDSLGMPHVAANNGIPIHYRNGKQNTYTFPMGVLKAPEGYIAIQAPGQGPASAWGRLCALMGREDMLEDPRYKTDDDRLARRDEVVKIIEDWLGTMPDDDAALTVLAEARISSGPVLSHTQIYEHPHFRARGAFQPMEYPELGQIEVVSPPYKFSETPAKVAGPAPQLGEHNYDVLAAYLGMSTGEVQDLTDQGVLFETEAAQKRRLAGIPSGD
jgi:crotonobetainyl-CoA:carnitine CoA-transferase CaiB-like acyl-CoA transferase